MRALYTERELRTDPTFNELLRATEARNGLNIRMDGPDGLHVAWVFADPVKPAGWGCEQAGLLESILPHVRQFVRVRHALVRAEAASASLGGLHDASMLGIVHLDWRGRIVEANPRAGEILRRGDGLTTRCGVLRARRAADDTKLGRRLARALPPVGGQAFGASMTVERTASRGRFSLQVCPLAGHRASFGIGRVAALVLIVDPAASLRIDPGRAAAALGLTRAEGQVAAALAGGASVSDIAARTHRAVSTVRWTIKRIHAKLGISRQAELVRMVLSTARGPRATEPEPPDVKSGMNRTPATAGAGKPRLARWSAPASSASRRGRRTCGWCPGTAARAPAGYRASRLGAGRPPGRGGAGRRTGAALSGT